MDQPTLKLLHRAVDSGDVRRMRALLLTGAVCVDARDAQGMTALHRACILRVGAETIAMLLENGANPNARDERQNTPLHFMFFFDRGEPHPDLKQSFMLLLRSGADPQATNERRKTPLAWVGEPLDVYTTALVEWRQDLLETLLEYTTMCEDVARLVLEYLFVIPPPVD